MSQVSTPEGSLASLDSPFVLNGWYICALCPPSSNRFKTAADFSKHQLSPVHLPKTYRCPVLGPRLGPAAKHFSTLSGLAMHVESGTCGKKGSLNMILDLVNDKLQAFGLTEMRLLGQNTGTRN